MTTAAQASPSPVAPPEPRRKRPPWEDIVAGSWRPVALTTLAWIAAVVIVWEIIRGGDVYDFIVAADNRDVRVAQDASRLMLLWMLPVGIAGALATSFIILRRVVRGQAVRPPPILWAVIAGMGLPFLAVPGVEFENFYMAGLIVIAFSTALAYALRAYLLERASTSWRRWDLSRVNAWRLTLAAWLTFILVMGFLSHWRFITFHAEPYDSSWETNAVWGITHHGIPTVSIGADPFYRRAHLPANYFDLHTPFSYYLYAPFYLVWPDARVLLWLQAIWMGAGSLGAYLIGRKWLGREWAGALLAWVYVLNPGVQNHCLHDIHANFLAIPTVVLAAGLMEAGRVRAAVLTAFVAALCREETALYSACLGLFWMFSFGGDRRRLRSGLVVVVGSAVILVLVTGVLMPASGGQPRWSHFNLFFRGAGIGSVLGSFLLNPWGSLRAASAPDKLDLFWMSFVPAGLLALWGVRAWWFALASLALLVASGNASFFTVGVNYSAPIGIATTMISYMGARSWLLARRNRTLTEFSANRMAVMAYLGATAMAGNILWGNILSKTYQLEYGQPPFRRSSQYEYHGRSGSVAVLPPYGQRERDLWDAIGRVPKGVPIATSWSINPQLASRDVAVILPNLAETNPPDNHAKYVVVDKLPPIMEPAEKWWVRFRNDPAWRVYFENRAAVIFERR